MRGLQVAPCRSAAWARCARRGGRAHFLGDRVGHVAVALLVFGEDALQQLDALFAAGLREGLERLARRP